MSKKPASPSAKLPNQNLVGNNRGRLLALIEVIAAFALVHLTYRSFKHFTELGRAEVGAGLNFSTGATMVLFSVGLLGLCRRNFEEYGLTFKSWTAGLNVGLLWGVLYVLVAGLVIYLARIPFDPLHPPDLQKSFVSSAGELVNILLLLWFLMRERVVLRLLPPLVSLLILVALLAIPALIAACLERSVSKVALTVLWLFFGAGFGEEIFFRGYIQGRINHSFGRPFQILKADFGLGLLVSSVLFGFIHVLNTVDYFGGSFNFAWSWWLPNFAVGLFFGLLRERSGSILAGAIIHGLSDVLAVVPGLFQSAP